MTLLNSIRLMLILAGLLFNFVEIAHSEDRTPDLSHFAILGLTVGDCAAQDIYSKLGPGIPFKSKAKANVTQVCYVSDKDETLLVFSLEFLRCARVRLLSQKKKFYQWHFCEKSPLVSKHLAFAGGIKLGISKNRLKAILGAPRSETDETLNYVYEWRQKMSKTGIEETGQHPQADQKNNNRTVKATIRAEFSDTGLISFEVSKNSQ